MKQTWIEKLLALSKLRSEQIIKWLSGDDAPILYIGGSDALPAPLTPEEEADLLRRLTPDAADVKKTLIERNLRLVVYVARKFENTGIHIEDLISIGSIGLIKAINTFDPGKNIKLATYASRCIENEILMFLRKNHNTKTEVSIDEPLNTDWDGNELLLSDVLGSDDGGVGEAFAAREEKRVIHEAVAGLEPRERQIIELRFGLSGKPEMTQKDVADLLGISQSYISRLEKKIIARLREELTGKI